MYQMKGSGRGQRGVLRAHDPEDGALRPAIELPLALRAVAEQMAGEDSAEFGVAERALFCRSGLRFANYTLDPDKRSSWLIETNTESRERLMGVRFGELVAMARFGDESDAERSANAAYVRSVHEGLAYEPARALLSPALCSEAAEMRPYAICAATLEGRRASEVRYLTERLSTALEYERIALWPLQRAVIEALEGGASLTDLCARGGFIGNGRADTTWFQRAAGLKLWTSSKGYVGGMSRTTNYEAAVKIALALERAPLELGL